MPGLKLICTSNMIFGFLISRLFFKINLDIDKGLAVDQFFRSDTILNTR